MQHGYLPTVHRFVALVKTQWPLCNTQEARHVSLPTDVTIQIVGFCSRLASRSAIASGVVAWVKCARYFPSGPIT